MSSAPLAERLRWLALVVPLLVAFWLGTTCSSSPDPTPAAAPSSVAGAQQWTCSMHPQIKLPGPGACPICGMDLIPLTQATPPASSAEITLTPEARALARIRTSVVGRGEASSELRLLGKLEHDERKVRNITAWIAGRIDRLHVSEVGARIHSGQTVATIYSPEVYAAQKDLIQARKQRKALKDGLPIAKEAASATLRSARTRLSLLGLSKKTIVAMGKESTPRRSIALTASHGGTVLEQKVQQGDYVNIGQPLYTVASLRELWVQLDAYESDLPRIRQGQQVLLEVSSLPGEAFEGEVAFIDPVVDRSTRTARVRIEVPNKERRLRPGMLAEATLLTAGEVQQTAPLMIPDTAPLFTGTRAVVFVELPKRQRPTYEARDVQLGPLAGNHYPVLQGLSEGERVVTHGAFALDSELQIRGGYSMMQRDDDLTRRPGKVLTLPGAVRALGKELLEGYLQVQSALSQDDAAKAGAAAKQLAPLTKRPVVLAGRARTLWLEHTNSLAEAATTLGASSDLKPQRESFLKLSQAMLGLVRHFGNLHTTTVRLTFCPMANGNRGAHWLQLANRVENPYFGSKMYRCGDVQQELAPGMMPKAAKAESHAGHDH